MNGIQICGTGSYLPPISVENEAFTSIVETSDEWIRTRTGIVSRHIADRDTVSGMGAKAAKAALEQAGISPEQVDLLIVTTITADCSTPQKTEGENTQELKNVLHNTPQHTNSSSRDLSYPIIQDHRPIVKESPASPATPVSLGPESNEVNRGRKRRNSHRSAVFGEAGNGTAAGISELVRPTGFEPAAL